MALRRESFLPFSRPVIGQEEIAELIDSIESGWLTTGPKTAQFEERLAMYNHAPYVRVMNSATTAQEISLQVMDLQPGDEVITSSLTWVSTLSTIVLRGGIPVLVDINPCTLNMDPEKIEAAITSRTKGIIPVHLTGLPCDMDRIWSIAERHHLWVIEDAAQAMGASFKGKKIGSDPRSVMSIFSFHPNKNMTTGEGGAIALHDEQYLNRIARLRFHGIEKDAWKRQSKDGSPHIDVMEPARKANFMDLQAALGLHQLLKLDQFNQRRGELFKRYLQLFRDVEECQLPWEGDETFGHCYHLFVFRLLPDKAGLTRDEFVQALKERNIGSGIHYRPAHLHTFYQHYYQAHPHALPADGLPHAEWSGDRLLSLPLWPGLLEEDQDLIVRIIKELVSGAKKK